jgi:hypothetical protein
MLLSIMQKTILLSLLLFTSSTWAVVFSNTPELPRSVIAIGGERGGLCTGTIVGMNPPTVITAKHCAQKNMVIFMTAHPDKIIMEDFGQTEFSVEKTLLPGDLAVLIYPQSSAPMFQEKLGTENVMHVSTTGASEGEKITSCGYGSSDPRRGYPNGGGFKRCGQNYAHVTETKGKGKAKHISEMINANLAEFGTNTRIGIGSVLPDGKFDKTHSLSLLQQGDSGGPTFKINEQGEVALIGVNSFTVFEENQVVASVLWNVASPWSQALLKKAVEDGADIHFN